MKVGIIIINYNRRDLLGRCLASLAKIDYGNHEVIVVDNGSEDDSVKFVREKFVNAKIIEVGFNSGFCKANNLGIELAWKICCEAILLLNNDTEVESDFLSEMVKYIDLKKGIGMIAAKVLFMNKRDVIDSAGLLITPDGLGKNRGSGESSNFLKEAREVFSPVGAAALYTKEVLEDIKENNQYLDEDYKFYLEELDLGWRARLRNWRCIYAHNAVVYHLKGATSGVYSELVAYHANRNLVYNLIKNYPFFFLVRGVSFSVVRYFFLLAGVFIGKGPGYEFQKRVSPLKIMVLVVRGWRDIVVNLAKMLKKRKFIQSRKMVKTDEINRWFRELGLTFLESIYK